MRSFGVVIVLIALAIPAYWFAQLTPKRDAEALFSQYLGVTALVAMGLSQLLATRMAFLEPIFGGLDRIYVLHKWLGVGAIVAILLHDTIDAEMEALGRQTGLMEFAETLGEISLYGILILGVLTIATWVPYQFWRLTHKFMGAFFVLSALHFIFIGKPFDLGDPLAVYVLAFCAVGTLSYLYTLVPFGILQGRAAYEVAAVDKTDDTVAISLKPLKGGISHLAGQFAFVSFVVPGKSEVHPFTISSAPNADKTIRFTAKALGDYTRSLGELAVGTRARVSRAYGHFLPSKRGSCDVWIGAGIGITPFLAWSGRGDLVPRPTHLFYSVQSRNNAVGLHELEAAAARDPQLTLHVVDSTVSGRLTADMISDAVGGVGKGVNAHFCGPKPMRKALKDGLVAKGMRRSAFHYEEFEIRSDLGLRKMSGWLMARSLRRFRKTTSS
ncbi:ferredoxin reductase family protein [Pyruvatibacter sp.]